MKVNSKDSSTGSGTELTRNMMHKVIANVLSTRTRLMEAITGSPTRDVDKECQHPVSISIQDYKAFFERGDIAARIVKVLPEESWQNDPTIHETQGEDKTEFDLAWAILKTKFNLFSMMQRGDVLSGIGEFGILILGIDDGKKLSEPAANIDAKGDTTGTGKNNLIYVRVLDQEFVTIKTSERDVSNPRFGMPLTYSVQFTDTGEATGNQTGISFSEEIHWTRVIHLADNRVSSEVFGQPRMRVVYNRLLDLKKVLGGCAEMFWKGGFPGLALEAAPGMEQMVELDEEATREQMQAYFEGLQRYVAMIGMNVKSLAPQIADPTKTMEAQVRMISIALSIPWRILMGVEVGQLASEQDMRAWNNRLGRRQNQYLDPYVVRPLVDRLIAYGALPKPKENYLIDWPDLHSPSDQDKAEVAEKTTNALTKYVQGAANMIMPPFFFLTEVLGFSAEKADAIIESAGASIEMLDEVANALTDKGGEPTPKQKANADGNPV